MFEQIKNWLINRANSGYDNLIDKPVEKITGNKGGIPAPVDMVVKSIVIPAIVTLGVNILIEKSKGK